MTGSRKDRRARVRAAIERGAYSLLGGKAALESFTFTHRRGVYSHVNLYVGHRKVEVTISPKGNSVMVAVDGMVVQERADG